MNLDFKDVEKAIKNIDSPIVTDSTTLLRTPLQDLIKELSNNGYNTISITLNAYKDLDKEENE